MKLTFEGTLEEIANEMIDVLAVVLKEKEKDIGLEDKAKSSANLASSPEPQGPSPEVAENDEAEESETIVPEVIPTVDALPETPPPPKKKGRPPAKAAKPPAPKKAEAAEEEAPALSPAELAELREKTTEELRAAYSNGHEKAVTKLLKQYGNGATSFRELAHEAFIPIRKAIDAGALA